MWKRQILMITWSGQSCVSWLSEKIDLSECVKPGDTDSVSMRSYHILLSSACSRHPDHDVFAHVSLSGLPADVQGAGGGISNLQVPHKTQRLWAETQNRKTSSALWIRASHSCCLVRGYWCQGGSLYRCWMTTKWCFSGWLFIQVHWFRLSCTLPLLR